MADIGHLTRKRPQSLTVRLSEEDTINLSFDVNALTPALMELPLREALPVVILEWDISKDGLSFPPTLENVEQLSYSIQHKLMRELVAAATPGEAEGNESSPSTSGPSLASTQDSQSSPNGSTTSSLPEPSGSLSGT